MPLHKASGWILCTEIALIPIDRGSIPQSSPFEAIVSGTATAAQFPDPKMLDDSRTLSAFLTGRHLAHSDAALSDELTLSPQRLRDNGFKVPLL